MIVMLVVFVDVLSLISRGSVCWFLFLSFYFGLYMLVLYCDDVVVVRGEIEGKCDDDFLNIELVII